MSNKRRLCNRVGVGRLCLILYYLDEIRSGRFMKMKWISALENLISLNNYRTCEDDLYSYSVLVLCHVFNGSLNFWRIYFVPFTLFTHGVGHAVAPMSVSVWGPNTFYLFYGVWVVPRVKARQYINEVLVPNNHHQVVLGSHQNDQSSMHIHKLDCELASCDRSFSIRPSV